MAKLTPPGPGILVPSAAVVFGLLMAIRSSVSGVAARSTIASMAFATMGVALLYVMRARKKR